MGFGDPCHKHRLKWRYNRRDKETIKCLHCKLKIESDDGCSCSRCDYWVHFSCIELPRFMAHPLHPQHILTLVCEDTDTTNLCNGCQTPCIGGSYSYQCRACRFFLHPKCFYKFKHKKHKHILSFSTSLEDVRFDCRICGGPVYDSNFGCTKCGFFIHHDCSLIPLTVKHHHVHELTIRHKFPSKCDQVYCDMCEDRDGKEIDRTLSYYYCKKCDYIAHVRCITQQRNDVFLVERYTHEHPLRLVRDPMIRDDNAFKLSCDQCNEVFDDQSLSLPSLIKHPLHPDHTLTRLFGVDNGLFKCTACEFTLNVFDAKLTHPLIGDSVGFVCDRILFGCDACGELGSGCRMYDRDLDFHLECYALPGKLEHESHTEHPLYLLGLDASTYRSCNLCNEEIDPELWKYYCPECDYVAHLNCVASGLLSTLRLSIKNESRFCAFLEPDKTSFDYQIANDEAIRDTSTSAIDLGIKEAGNVLCCPKCNKLVSTPAMYSSIQEWKSGELSDFETLVNDLSQSKSEPLTLLSEQQIDDLYCPICSVLIFPPTYSCSSCQIYFHKSCANLPRQIKMFRSTLDLIEPPFPDNLPSCFRCDYPISGYAYFLSDAGFVYDVQCSLAAPLTNQVIDGHRIFCGRSIQKAIMCKACGTCVDDGVPMFCSDRNPDCSFSIHTECALLPHIIRHKVHKHPLELVYNLAELDDEYICDACEKGLNPYLSAYRCVDTCKGYATSHVTCVITSKKKSHFKYDLECQDMTEDQKIAFRSTTEGTRKYRIV